jgi:hypothetical protein
MELDGETRHVVGGVGHGKQDRWKMHRQEVTSSTGNCLGRPDIIMQGGWIPAVSMVSMLQYSVWWAALS